jgi:hypothetical protein
MNKKLAAIVKRAAQLREESWVDSKNLNHIGGYTLSLEDACIDAAKEHGEPECGRLVYLALYGWWNDALDWAEEQLS